LRPGLLCQHGTWHAHPDRREKFVRLRRNEWHAGLRKGV